MCTRPLRLYPLLALASSVLSLAAASCGSDAEPSLPFDAGDAARETAPEVLPDAPAPMAPDASHDAAPEAAAEAPADQPPSMDAVDASDSAEEAGDAADGGGGDGATADPWERYATFFVKKEQAFVDRRIECLNLPRELSQAYQYKPDLELKTNFRFGFVEFDDAAAAGCLRALAQATCDEIAAAAVEQFFTGSSRWKLPVNKACNHFLKGRLAAGELCIGAIDCAGPESNCIGDDFGTDCTRVCQPPAPRSAVGESCASRDCADGAFCLANAIRLQPTICAPIGQLGAACAFHEDCDSGLFCRFQDNTRSTGTCQAIHIGSACAGPWACPLYLSCRAAGTGATGTCLPSKLPGEACTSYQPGGFGGAVSDCTLGLPCYAPPGMGKICTLARAVGDPCGDFPDLQATRDVPVACAEPLLCTGNGGTTSTCQLPVATEGAPCPTGFCAAGLSCLSANQGTAPLTCHRVHQDSPPGGRCSSLDTECQPTAYCQDEPTATNLAAGTCTRFRQAGEECDRERRCDWLLTCESGVCQTCTRPL